MLATIDAVDQDVGRARQFVGQAAFDAQKTVQRSQIMDLLRRQRIQDFVANLRAEAKIVDNRKKIDQAARRSEET